MFEPHHEENVSRTYINSKYPYQRAYSDGGISRDVFDVNFIYLNDVIKKRTFILIASVNCFKQYSAAFNLDNRS